MIHSECRLLQLPVLVDMLLLALFLCNMLDELGQNGNDINYCCKLLVVQSSSILHSLFVSSFRQTYHVAASVYTLRGSINLHNIHGSLGTLTQESQFSWYLQVAETHFLWQFIAFQN